MSDEIQMCCRRQNLRGMWVDDRGWGCRCVPGQPGVVNSWVVWSGAMSFHLGYWWSVLKGNNCGVRGAVTQILCFLLLTPHMQRHAHARQSWVDGMKSHSPDWHHRWTCGRCLPVCRTSCPFLLVSSPGLTRRTSCHLSLMAAGVTHTHTQKEKNQGSYLDRLQLLT